MKSLRCLFGRHTPSAGPVSNHGYRFSRCCRCGEDIVQSVFSGWRRPGKGFRIVWHPVQAAQHAIIAKAPPIRPLRTLPPGDFMAADDNDFAWMRKFNSDPPCPPTSSPDFMREAG